MADEIPNGSLHAPGSGGSGAAGAAYENSVHAAKRHKGDEEPRVGMYIYIYIYICRYCYWVCARCGFL